MGQVRLYFSRPEIYKERKKLGSFLFPKVLKSIKSDLKNTVFSYIPNTAETSFYGLIGAVQDHLKNKINKELKKDIINKEYIKNIFNLRPRIEKIAVRYNLELRGVSNFNRIQPDDSELPLPLISKVFDSKINEVLVHPRDKIDVLLAQTASITNSYGKNKDDLESFKKKIQDDMSIDILAQFSEILRQKYKISINDDVINQLN